MSDKDERKKLLAYLTEHGEINASMAAKLIERSPATARRVLSQLVKDGALVATGANRNRKYKVIDV